MSVVGWSVVAQGGAAGGESNLLQLILPFALIAALYYTMFVLPQKTRDRRLQDLAKSLKENDHVVTTGGIYGVVTNVQRDADRVTLRVDETSGAKIRVTIEAIGRVLDDGSRKNDDKKDKAADKSGGKPGGK
ncbi:MAG: preprotein translocase subunit YajC [Planctomycetota bacterium]